MRKRSLAELNRLDPATFKAAPKTPLVVVLDDVRSALNVGSVFRTADAFALQKIYLCGITAQPPHREIMKTAIGATETVDWAYHISIVELVGELRAQGYEIWAVEQAEGSTSLADYMPTNRPVALIFGNEVNGVNADLMTQVHGALEVPQFGTKHSLNIAVCAGIVIWEVFQKLSKR